MRGARLCCDMWHAGSLPQCRCRPAGSPVQVAKLLARAAHAETPPATPALPGYSTQFRPYMDDWERGGPGRGGRDAGHGSRGRAEGHSSAARAERKDDRGGSSPARALHGSSSSTAREDRSDQRKDGRSHPRDAQRNDGRSDRHTRHDSDLGHGRHDRQRAQDPDGDGHGHERPSRSDRHTIERIASRDDGEPGSSSSSRKRVADYAAGDRSSSREDKEAQAKYRRH